MNNKLLQLLIIFLCWSAWTNVPGQVPSYSWGHSWGTPANESVISIELDSQRNVYVAGRFRGTIDFDPGPDTASMTSYSNGFLTSVYILKFDRDGQFLWVNVIGSSGGMDVAGIVKSPDGNYFITGTFSGEADFDPGPDQFLITANNLDTYLMKMDPDGQLLWAKAIGGDGDEYFTCLSFDADGNIITGGFFLGTADLDPGPNDALFTFMGHAVDGIDMFAAKYSSTGDYIWGKQFPGDSLAFFNDLNIDEEGNLFFLGALYDVRDFDPGPDSVILNTAGQADIFLLKLNASGDFQWVKQMGGTGDDGGNGFVRNENGDILITGYFHDDVDFDPGPGLQLFSADEMDIFLVSLDHNGEFEWLHTIGGDNNDFARVIRKDPSGNLYVMGYFADTVDFDPGPGVHTLSDIGNTSKPDAFILKLDPSGDYRWAYQLGGPGTDRGTEVRFDQEGREIFLTGLFEQKAIRSPGLSGMDTVTAIGARDVFLAKWTQCEATTSEQNIITCSAAFVSPSGHYLWTESGTYQDTILNMAGCDSIMTINLNVVILNATILLQGNTLVSENTANSYQWIDCINGFAIIPGATNQEYTPPVSGDYAVIIEASGCIDTSACLAQCVESYAEIFHLSCGAYTSPSGHYTWTESGVYMDTIQNKAGCDSILTITLTISDLGLTIHQEENTLVGEGGASQFFWIDCDHNNEQVGQGSVFTPAANGNYALVGAGFACTDTSECFSFVMTGTSDLNSAIELSVFPNPARNSFTIDLHQSCQCVKISMIDQVGRKVYTHEFSGIKIIPVYADLLPGLYFISIQVADQILLRRVLME